MRGDHVVAKHEQIGGADARVRLQADAEAVQHVLQTPHGLCDADGGIKTQAKQVIIGRVSHTVFIFVLKKKLRS